MPAEWINEIFEKQRQQDAGKPWEATITEGNPWLEWEKKYAPDLYEKTISSFAKKARVSPIEGEDIPDWKVPDVELAPEHLQKPDYQELSNSPDYLDLVSRGLQTGVYEMLALPGVVGSWLAHRLRLESVAESSKGWADFWMNKADELRPKDLDMFNVMDNPEVLASAAWWVYNLAEMAPSMVLTMGAGALAMKGGAKLGARMWARKMAGKAITEEAAEAGTKFVTRAGKIGAWIGGGVTGGATEAQQTYLEILKRGGSEEEAARSAELMFFGVGALNAFGTEWILRKAGNTFLSKVGRVFGASMVEGITEGLEEPWEVISKLGGAILAGQKLPDDVEGMFYDSLKSALTVFPLAAVMGGGAEVVTTVSNTKLERLRKEYEDNRKLAKDYYLKKITKISDETIDKTSTTGHQKRLFREPPGLFDQPMGTQADETAKTVLEETPPAEAIIKKAEEGQKSDVKAIEDMLPPEGAGPAGQPPQLGPGPAGEGTATGAEEAPLGFIPFPQFWDATPADQAEEFKRTVDFMGNQAPEIHKYIKEAYENMLMEHFENIKIEVTKAAQEAGVPKDKIDDVVEQFTVEAQASFDNRITHRQILDRILEPFAEEPGGEGAPGTGPGEIIGGPVGGGEGGLKGTPTNIKEINLALDIEDKTGKLPELPREHFVRLAEANGIETKGKTPKQMMDELRAIRDAKPGAPGGEAPAEAPKGTRAGRWKKLFGVGTKTEPTPEPIPAAGAGEAQKAAEPKHQPPFYTDTQGRNVYVNELSKEAGGGFGWYRTEDLNKKGRRFKPPSVPGDMKGTSTAVSTGERTEFTVPATWTTREAAQEALHKYAAEQPWTAPEGFEKRPRAPKEAVTIHPVEKMQAQQKARQELARRQPYLAEHILLWGGVSTKAGEEITKVVQGMSGKRMTVAKGLDLFRKNGNAMDVLVSHATEGSNPFIQKREGWSASEYEEEFIRLFLKDLEARTEFSELTGNHQAKWRRLNEKLNKIPKEATEERKAIQLKLKHIENQIRAFGEQTGRVGRIADEEDRAGNQQQPQEEPEEGGPETPVLSRKDFTTWAEGEERLKALEPWDLDLVFQKLDQWTFDNPVEANKLTTWEERMDAADAWPPGGGGTAETVTPGFKIEYGGTPISGKEAVAPKQGVITHITPAENAAEAIEKAKPLFPSPAMKELTKAEKMKKLFEEPEKPFELKPTEPTTEEKIAEGIRKGILKKGPKGGPRAKLPEEKRKAPTTGKQESIIEKPAEKGEQSDFLDEAVKQAKSEEKRKALEGQAKEGDEAAQKDIKDILDTLQMRKEGIPHDTPISPAGLVQVMMANAYFKAAKSGDVEAAAKLVQALVSPEQIAFAKKFGKEAIYVPIIADEKEGKNKIPLAFAYHVASKTGAKVSTDIIQASRVARKGKGLLERMFRRADFEGKVRKGGLYVIFDDALVTGGTIAEVANHILQHGGQVVGIMALGKTPGAWYDLTIDQATYNEIRERFGHAIEEIFAVNPSALTSREAQFFLKAYRTVDALREAAAETGYRQFRGGFISALPEGGPSSIDPEKYVKIKGILDKLWKETQALAKTNGLTDDETDVFFIDRVHKLIGRDERIKPYFHKFAEDTWQEAKEAKDEKATRRTKVHEPADPGGPPTPGGVGEASPGGGRQGIRPGLRVADEDNLPEPRDQIPAGQYSILGEEQRLGINLILDAFDRGKKGFLLSDGTGVGKTMIQLVAAKLWAQKTGKKSLIIAPNLQIIEGRFREDARYLKMDLSQIEFATYSGLRVGKGGQGTYGVVIFDEAHNLKNMEAEKTLAANDIKADHRVYATATPMDKPTGAAYFLSRITGIPEARLHTELGFVVREVWIAEEKKFKKFTERLPGVSWARVMENIVKFRHKAILEGTILRREYPLFGNIKIEAEPLPAHLAAEQHRIEDYWGARIAAASMPIAKMHLRGQRTQELSRWADAQKVDRISERVADDLANGFRVVIVAHGVEPTIIKGLQKRIPQLIGGLVENLKQRGITDFAKIYGPNQVKKLSEIRRFQADKVKVAIMTAESGGAGVDLDDVHGDKPRRVYISSPSFQGDTFQQVIGRFSRRNTASPVEIVFPMWQDSEGDNRRAIVVTRKIETLRRIQEGDDIDKAIGFEDTEEMPTGSPPMSDETPRSPPREDIKARIDEIAQEVKARPVHSSIRDHELALLKRLAEGKEPIVYVKDDATRKHFQTNLWLTWKAQSHGISQKPIADHVELVHGGGDINAMTFQVLRPYGKLHFDPRDGELKLLSGTTLITDAIFQGPLINAQKTEREVKAGIDPFTNWINRMKDVANANPAKTLVTELFQNSRDALVQMAKKGAKQVGAYTPTLTIRWSRSENLVEFDDNGIGMTATQIEKNFLVLGDINKGTEDSGAFGLAKAFFLLYPKAGRLETVKEGKRHIIEWEPEDVFLAKKMKVRTEDFNGPNGTKVTLFLNEKMTPRFDWRDFVTELDRFASSVRTPGLRINLEPNIGLVTDRGPLSKVPDFDRTMGDKGSDMWKTVTTVGWDSEKLWKGSPKVPTGKMKFNYLGNKGTVYFVEIDPLDLPRINTKSFDGRPIARIFTYNKGMPTQVNLPSFMYWHPLSSPENLCIYVDFEDTVRPEQSQFDLKEAWESGDKDRIDAARDKYAKDADAYPWINNRKDLSDSSNNNLSQVIGPVLDQLRVDQIARQMERFKKMINEASEVNGMKVLIPFKDDAEKQIARKIFNDNKDFFGAWSEYYDAVGKLMENVRKEYPGMMLPERKLYLTLMQGIAGFVPNQKTVMELKGPEYAFIALNPLGHDERYLKWMKQNGMDITDPANLHDRAAMIVFATIHEFAHLYGEGHTDSNSDPFAIAHGMLGSAVKHIRLAILEEQVYEILQRFKGRLSGIESDLSSLGAGGNEFSQDLGTVVGPEWIQGPGAGIIHPLSTGTGSPGERGGGRGFNRGDLTSALLGRAGSPQAIQNLTQQPTGRQVAWDYEQNRTWAVKLFEMLNPAEIHISNTINKLQKKIQGLAGSASKVHPVRNPFWFLAYDKRLKRSQASDDLDRAMFLFRDSANGNREVFNRFRQIADAQLNDPNGYLTTMGMAADSPMGKRILSGEHKLYLKKILRLLDVAERMNPDQVHFVDEMAELFRDAGALANRHGLLKSFVENYVRRVYKARKGEDITPTGQGHAFKTYFTPAMPRTYHYALDAILDGYELGTEGITNAYKIYMDELTKVIQNKAFIKLGMGTYDSLGQQLFSTNRKDGYDKLNGFNVWVWAGDVWAEKEIPGFPALHINEYGKRFFATPPRELPEMWKVGRKYFDDEAAARQYAKERGGKEVTYVKAKDTSTFFEKVDLYAPKQLAEIINKMTQTDTLFRSGALNEVMRFNAGIKAWVLMSSFFHHLAGTRSWVFGVNHGWKWSKVAPWRAYKAGLDKINALHPLIILGVKNGLTLGEIADFSEFELRSAKGFTERIVSHFGLEKPLGLVEWFKFKRESWADSLFKKFFAGLKAEAFAIEYNHALQGAMDEYRLGKRNATPDPDRIAEAVAKLINDDFGGLHLKRMGRNPTLQNLFRLTFLAPDWTESNFRYVFASLGLEGVINKMVTDIAPPPEYKALARKFVTRVMLRIAVMTILAQLMLNWKDDTEDFLKEQMFSNRFNRFRWTEVDISKLYQMMGVDPEQRTTFSIGGHFFDPLKMIAPFKLMKGKGSPVWRIGDALFSGSDWAERPFTSISELAATGKTVKKSFHQPKEGELSRLPSIVVNQITNMQPIQVGHAIRYWQGEEDALTALLQSSGAMVHKAWKPYMETPIAGKSGPDLLMDVITDLKDKNVLKMGPPAKILTIQGKQYQLTPKQYKQYVDDSTALTRRRLEPKVEAINEMPDARKSKLIETVVLDSRKTIAGRIKRDLLVTAREKGGKPMATPNAPIRTSSGEIDWEAEILKELKK